MNLLLLLSAILSALTGAQGSARVPAAPVTVSQAAGAVTPAQVARAASGRPAAAQPGPARERAVPVIDLATAPTAPLYLSRRRE